MCVLVVCSLCVDRCVWFVVWRLMCVATCLWCVVFVFAVSCVLCVIVVAWSLCVVACVL